MELQFRPGLSRCASLEFEGKMPNVVQAVDSLGFDCDIKLTPGNARAAAAMGFKWCARYLPLFNNALGWDLEANEVGVILAAGLDLMGVQHVRRYWHPNATLGQQDGKAAADAAKAAGVLPGVHLFLDLEDIAGSTGDTINHAAAWSSVVIAEGFRAGLYVGFAVPLTPLQLYDLPGFDQYWSDFGKREVATRGFSIRQQSPSPIIGVGLEIDVDVLTADHKGDRPYMLSP
jgi:hypothetical protein